MIAILHNNIPHVLLAAAGSGNVPAPPAVFEGRILASDEGRGLHHLCAGCAGKYGTQQHSRYAACGGCYVALGAIKFGALKCRLFGLVRIKEIKNRALRWIEGDHFKSLAIVHKSDVHVVIEIECARSLRGDLLVLKACLREDQCLRTDGNSQLLEN